MLETVMLGTFHWETLLELFDSMVTIYGTLDMSSFVIFTEKYHLECKNLLRS